MLDLLRDELGLTDKSVVADIGAGTGIFSKLLLDRGVQVLAVEPNEPMRLAAEQWLGGNKNFKSIAAKAEATTLPPASVDLITVAQAFHWCDPVESRREFKRILRPQGAVALIWNTRKETGREFNVEYEALISRYGTDYHQIKHANTRANGSLEALWPGPKYKTAVFENSQKLDFEGLKGRLVSSSYIPKENHPSFEPMMAELKGLFERAQVDGLVEIQYETEVFYGPIG